MPSIEENRKAKAKLIARFLYKEFLRVVQGTTPEERQNAALKAGANADKPPSDQTWFLVLEILKERKNAF